jgi:hypothetical protein
MIASSPSHEWLGYGAEDALGKIHETHGFHFKGKFSITAKKFQFI